jgi:hypothetical protein
VMSSAAGLWKLFRDQAERGSGIGLKLFGFIAESVFTIIPESCSGSSWNSVRNHPGIAFTLDRIPQEHYRRSAHAEIERSSACERAGGISVNPVLIADRVVSADVHPLHQIVDA